MGVINTDSINTYIANVLWYFTHSLLSQAARDFCGMQTELQRRNLVTRALNVTKGTGLAPGPYGRQLLEQFVQGALSIEEVITLVAEKSGCPASAVQDTADCLLVTPLRDAS